MSDRIDAIRDRLAKATPGPWETVPTTGNAVASPDGDGYWTDVADRIESEPDADLIANAPADLAYLLAELDKAWAASVVHVSHYDMEARAAHFNEGYEAAMSQHLAEDPSAAEDWLNAKLAEAWREGFSAGYADGTDTGPTSPDNPYKEAP